VAEEHHLLVHRVRRPLEGRPELGGESLLLALVDAEQPQRGDELLEMPPGGRDRQQRPGGVQHAAHLRGVARGEEVGHQHRGAAPDGQWPPDVAEHGAGPGMGAGRASQRRPGGVQRQPGAAGEPVEDRRQVVTGPGAHVHHAARRGQAADRGRRLVRDPP
jgi:hypothetical protein